MGNQTTSAANRRDSNADESDQLATASNPRFDERSIFGNIRSTPDGKTIYRDKTVTGNAYAAVNRRLEDGGIYEWKLCIDEDSRASCCGVADCPLATPPRVSVGGEDDDLSASKHLRICRSKTGQLYDRGVKLPETIAPFWKAGSIVRFVADLAAKGTISVGVGENDPIVAFTNVTGPLVPIVVFQARFGEKVTLVDFKRVTEMAATRRSPSPPPRCTSEEVRKLCKRSIDGVGFDRNSMEGSLDLSEDCMTLSRTEGMRGNAICAFNRRISRGCASWTFRVYADTGASTIIGVAEDEAHILPANACVFYSPHVYAWRSYEGRVYEKGNEVPDRLPTFDWANECSTIGVVLDMDARTMWFTCDRQILTVPVSGFNGPVRPIVGFYAGMPKCVAIDNYFESENPEEEEEEESAGAAAVVSYGDPINFHNSTLVGRLEVINGGDTLFRMPGTLENSYCLANIPLGDGSGTYEWTVVVEQDTGASTCLGVAERPIELSADKRQSVYESPSVWVCRSYRGQLYARGVELTTRMICPFWQPGCVVKLTFNADVGTLAYAVDGTDHGVAFRGVPRPVFPFFAFYAMMEKRLTLLHFRHVPPTRRRAAAMNDLSAKVDVRRDYAERKNEKVVVRTTKKKPSATVDGPDRVKQCCVCHDRIGVKLQPCMHSIVCWECAAKLSENDDNCPQCGTPVTGFLNDM